MKYRHFHCPRIFLVVRNKMWILNCLFPYGFQSLVVGDKDINQNQNITSQALWERSKWGRVEVTKDGECGSDLAGGEEVSRKVLQQRQSLSWILKDKMSFTRKTSSTVIIIGDDFSINNYINVLSLQSVAVNKKLDIASEGAFIFKHRKCMLWNLHYFDSQSKGLIRYLGLQTESR